MKTSRSSKIVLTAAMFATTLVCAFGRPAEEHIKQLERDRQQAFIRGDIAGTGD